MKIQHAAVAMMAITMTTYDVSYYPSSGIVDAFVPSSLTPRVLTTSSSSTGMMINKLLSSPTRSNHLHPSSNHHNQHSRTRSKKSTSKLNQSSQDFDQQQYTDAAWSAIATLPQCATSYSATSVDAPMLLSILLNPTKYQAPEVAQTAKAVTVKLLEDANVNVDKLRDDVEEYLENQPKVSGDTSSQKSMGRVLGEVLEAGRGVRDGLKVRITCIMLSFCFGFDEKDLFMMFVWEFLHLICFFLFLMILSLPCYTCF